MSFFCSADSDCISFLLPLRAIVPRLPIISSRVMPTPLSRIVSVPALSSRISSMRSSLSSPSSACSVSALKFSWSMASAALLISSRRNTSRWL